MQNQRDIQDFLLFHAAKYPALAIDDLLKALYQSAFGCGHFAPSEERVLAYLNQELLETKADPNGEIAEPILGRYSRVHIAPCARRGMRIETLSRLFMLTADEVPDEYARAWFREALDVLEGMAARGELPFDAQAVKERLQRYRADGCPSLHHSPAFRDAYHPAYRVIRSDYAQLLDVFRAIDRLLGEKERVLIAIDGNSGSGKSTLAELITKVYDDVTLVHMDDFFLQMHQRTPERFATPGGDVDHERFLTEVLAPMRRGEAFVYRPLDCAVMEIAPGKIMQPGKLCIVEGSYNLHPQLEGAYDLKLLLRINPAAQAERILARNGEWMLGRFLNEWIPLENLYFEETKIDRRCDWIIGIKPLADGLAQYDVQKVGERG